MSDTLGNSGKDDSTRTIHVYKRHGIDLGLFAPPVTLPAIERGEKDAASLLDGRGTVVIYSRLLSSR